MKREDVNDTKIIHKSQLLRLTQVLKLYPVCRSTWLNGVKSGKYPQPIKDGKCIFWRASEIIQLLDDMGK